MSPPARSTVAHRDRASALADGAIGVLRNAADFARERGRWVDLVLTDPVLTHFQARLGAVLALRHTNVAHFFETGELLAWPSQKLLAKETTSTEAGVRKAMLELVSRTYIDVDRTGGGRGLSTRYRLLMPVRLTVVGSQTLHGKAGVAVQGFDDKPLTTVAETPNRSFEEPCTTTPTTLKRDSFEDVRPRARSHGDWDQLITTLPARMVRISNLRRAQEIWSSAAATWGAARLLAAAVAYAADPAIGKQDHLPTVQTWLAEALFEQFLPSSQTSPSAPAWCGPAAIRDAVAAAGGPLFAASYLDPARWDDAGRRIVCRTTTARDRLSAKLSAQLSDLGVADIVGPQI